MMVGRMVVSVPGPVPTTLGHRVGWLPCCGSSPYSPMPWPSIPGARPFTVASHTMAGRVAGRPALSEKITCHCA